MSGTDTRWRLAAACEIADELVGLLGPACLRIVVAGSIRRGAADIGDIDLLCEPMTQEMVDLFGEPTGRSFSKLNSRCDDLVRVGTISRRLDSRGRQAWGDRLKRATYRGFAVDIRICDDPTTWGAWLLVSTGPAAFNKAVVTPRHQGGLLPPGHQFRDGFRLYRSGGRIETPTEESVFDALGIPWRDPEDRS